MIFEKQACKTGSVSYLTNIVTSCHYSASHVGRQLSRVRLYDMRADEKCQTVFVI